MADEEEHLKRKRSMEPLWHGKKKKRHIEAFYKALWPVLSDAGWTMVNVKGEAEEEGAAYFSPSEVATGEKSERHREDEPQSSLSREEPAPREQGPRGDTSWSHTNISAESRCARAVGETLCKAWRDGERRRHFKLHDVIERVLEKKNEVEAKAANAFVELVPDASDMFREQNNRNEKDESPSCPDEKNNDYCDWKYERTHFKKASSRVGPEFHVDVLPAVGSYTAPAKSDAYDGGSLYERVWDPAKAEKSGKSEFVHTRVKFNRKESAYDMLHSRGYRLPGFYREVSSISPTDCSEWTKKDKAHFRSAVLEHHENFKEVSRVVGKPHSECITYYLTKFKQTKSYKSLKRSMRHKANAGRGGTGSFVCKRCGRGGMLIACDTCEAHYHLACAMPPLTSIPDGTWNCGNCRRKTRSKVSSQDEMSCATDQSISAGLGSASVELWREIVLEEPCNVAMNASEGPGGIPKRKISSVVGRTQEETESKSEQLNGNSIRKKMPMSLEDGSCGPDKKQAGGSRGISMEKSGDIQSGDILNDDFLAGVHNADQPASNSLENKWQWRDWEMCKMQT